MAVYEIGTLSILTSQMRTHHYVFYFPDSGTPIGFVLVVLVISSDDHLSWETTVASLNLACVEKHLDDQIIYLIFF